MLDKETRGNIPCRQLIVDVHADLCCFALLIKCFILPVENNDQEVK